MIEAVLDASAVLAMLRCEPGGEIIAAIASACAISTVNHSEVADYYARQAVPRKAIEAMLSELAITVVPADAELAIDAAMLRPITQSAGLSLGDRFCLALAIRLDREALTTDQAWADIAEAADVKVRVIR